MDELKASVEGRFVSGSWVAVVHQSNQEMDMFQVSEEGEKAQGWRGKGTARTRISA
jgi:hypothetical protein